MLDAGISVHDLYGFEAALRLRYFGPRALIEDNSVRSKATTLLYASVGYGFSPTWSINLDIFNLLNSRVEDIAYYLYCATAQKSFAALGLQEMKLRCRRSVLLAYR